jgi:hypothetical protein
MKSNNAAQAFLSFDISMIPKGALVKSASLDLTNMNITGSPFTLLTPMAIFHDEYHTLDEADYVIAQDFANGYAGTSLVVTYSQPVVPYSYYPIRDVLQNLVDDGESRFRIRVQFEKHFVREGGEDLIEFIPQNTTLRVVYAE